MLAFAEEERLNRIKHAKPGRVDNPHVLQGAAEAGPGALGNRRILADLRHPSTKDLINVRAKQREFYRPFAPAVLEV